MGGRKGHDRHQGSKGFKASLSDPGPKPRVGKARYGALPEP